MFFLAGKEKNMRNTYYIYSNSAEHYTLSLIFYSCQFYTFINYIIFLSCYIIDNQNVRSLFHYIYCCQKKKYTKKTRETAFI